MRVSKTKPTNTITFKTSDSKGQSNSWRWWIAKSDRELGMQVIQTATYLKESQNFRYREAAINARLYGNQSLFSFVGSNMQKMDGGMGTNATVDRPTFNVVQSVVDTQVARISQSRPAPTFLTDNGDYKQRSAAKKLSNFIGGEFYQTEAYEKATIILRDALVEGTGCLKVYRTEDNKVGLDRVLLTELFTDPNESIYGKPRQLHQVKLVDRQVLEECFPNAKKEVNTAERSYVDNSADSSKTVSDLVMVVESWHLKSGKDAKDGRHVIACSSGVLLDEKEWDKDKFPFVFLHYCPRLYGFWAQGVAEQLRGSQLEINSLLFQISRAIKLVGVPRVFIEMGSKVNKAHFNNEIGTLIEFQGTKPTYEVAPCVPQELYAQLQVTIDRAFQQTGVSALDATSQKPAGLNSGEAIRSYDDISSDRNATLAKRYDNVFVDLAYLIIDTASDIVEETGEYSTIYPSKDGTKEIDFAKVELKDNPFIIQVFNQSSLPKDPAGRLQKVTEMITSGMISLKEGRRLLDFPDISQMEKLYNAAEERIFQQLDDIVEEGKYTPPDPFTDIVLAPEITSQYINLYSSAKLEEEKMQMLRDYYTQVQAIKTSLVQAATPPAAVPGAPPAASPPGGVPAASIAPPPTQEGINSAVAPGASV